MDQIIQYEVKPLEEMVRDHIINALQKTRGHVTKAAKGLNISRMSLYRRMAKYRIDRYGRPTA